MTMTLDDARAVFKATSEDLHSVANACSTNYRDAMQRLAVEFDKALAALDAYITQPAQSVDVEKVREVIAEIRRCAGNNNAKFHLTWADKLIAATSPGESE